MGDRAGLVVGAVVQIPLGVGHDQGLGPAVLGAMLAQVDLTVAQEHLSVDNSETLRAQAAREFVEDVIARGLAGWSQ